MGNQIPLYQIVDKSTKENGLDPSGLPASFDGLKKGWRKKDAKLEADKKEMQ